MKNHLNLPHASNYLHSIDIVLGITSNLEIIQPTKDFVVP